ncbi:MAG: formamidopyrimidine-DNA glycosylase [Myxococcales bacterium]|nr:formamidopyrimidine-DNA glycosylase [Myxococcales bacterium]MCB9547255.1 formamidopyrimidine-DNA glycosylase [Myxococcales bacterium]
MPELPDVTVYVERLEALLVGRTLRGVRLKSPFLLRTVAPPLSAAVGREVTRVRRLGKRIVLDVGDVVLVLHLMIAGRLRWRPPGAAVTARDALAAFDFDHGVVLFTEASPRKRASLHVIEPADLADFDRGGHAIDANDFEGFDAALRRENRTVKRALTDPRLFSGVGNAYSDEILFAARLSPARLTHALTADEAQALHAAAVSILTTFTDRLRAEVGEGFPEKVTAFRPDMAVHGRYGEPCRACGQPVQRIRYADNETNYCARCQNADRLLADRGLSRLLKKDWPRTLEELEALTRR